METTTVQEKQEITVKVFSPRSPDAKSFTWRKTTKVAEAAREAAKAFGYQGGAPGLQTTEDPPRVLDNNKTLVAEHIVDGSELEIVDTGGGV
ncbi:MAG TPA: hypothetical protein VEL79_17005 [Vicinamibacterales bacterium]|nr:hypothetical protein [Vicinamibacterales bacterium]